MNPHTTTVSEARLEPRTILAKRYRVSALIGRGGMGEVYSAWDSALDRPVALKVMTGLCTPILLERFRREAELASRFSHDAIVEILDVDCWSTPPFLVMELLDGPTLADQIATRRDRQPLHEVLELLAPIAGALDAIHADGYLHRDIKPDNILLARQPDGSQRPVLIDFGVAAATDMRWERLTYEGTVVGTPAYIAPEFATTTECLDARCDVYSLAVVAFLLYTGALPFAGDHATEVLRRKALYPAARASDMRRDATEAIDAVFEAALSRKPSDRPDSASDLIAALREAAKPQRSWWPTLTRKTLVRSGASMMALSSLIAAAAHFGAPEPSAPQTVLTPRTPATHSVQVSPYEYDLEPIPLARAAHSG